MLLTCTTLQNYIRKLVFQQKVEEFDVNNVIPPIDTFPYLRLHFKNTLSVCLSVQMKELYNHTTDFH